MIYYLSFKRKMVLLKKRVRVVNGGDEPEDEMKVIVEEFVYPDTDRYFGPYKSWASAYGKEILTRKHYYLNGAPVGKQETYWVWGIVSKGYEIRRKNQGRIIGWYSGPPGHIDEIAEDFLEKDNRKANKYTEYYYLNNRAHGKAKIHRENGKISDIYNHFSQSHHGVHKTYSGDLIRLREIFVHNQREGKSVGWYDNSTLVAWIHEYKNGQKNGWNYTFDEEGYVITQYQMENDIEHGMFLEWNKGILIDVKLYIRGYKDLYIQKKITKLPDGSYDVALGTMRFIVSPPPKYNLNYLK